MNRYNEANDRLHVPKELKQKTIRGAAPKRPVWRAVTAAAAVLAILWGVALHPQEEPASPIVSTAHAAEVLANAEYPEMVQAPDLENYDQESVAAWQKSIQNQLDQGPEDDTALYPYYRSTAREFLASSDGENRIYSPLNIYMALGMLAETTDGESRQQILDLLGSDSIEALREMASALWNVNYRDDGVTKSLLASSLWLRDDTQYTQTTLDTLANTYYASSYRGVMGSQEMDEALRSWLDEQTGGLLTEQIQSLSLDPDTVLALATTIHFKAGWAEKFSKSNTADRIFHAASGDVTVPFLNQTDTMDYYWGDDFTGVALRLTDGCRMYILLPDEDSSVEALLDSDAMEIFWNASGWEDRESTTVELSIPKFDVSSQMELSESLQNLGVTDVFDFTVSDFSPLTQDCEDLFVSQVQHDARVTIDEKGCEAAAYSLLTLETTCTFIPNETTPFVADRPFLFCITGLDGQPLFIGVVNEP